MDQLLTETGLHVSIPGDMAAGARRRSRGKPENLRGMLSLPVQVLNDPLNRGW